MRRRRNGGRGDWGTREREAYKRILRLIYTRRLGPGDTLPAQEDLRQHLGFSHFTLSRAMQRLVTDGVVTRKPRVGTVIAELDAATPAPWNVAVPLNWNMGAPPFPFYARLTCMLQSGLLEAGCLCRTYARHRHTPGPDPFGHYLDLEEDLAAGRVDGILATGSLDLEECARVAEAGIPVVFAGHWDLAPCGAMLDEAAFAVAAAADLLAEGYRRIGLLTPDDNPAYSRGRTVASRYLRAHGAAAAVVLAGAQETDGGRRAATKLLAQPPAARPEALIATDDHMALGLAEVLGRRGDYTPALAVLTHTCAPLAFALPVRRYNLDDTLMATAAVRLMLDRLLNPTLPDKRVLLAPEPQAAMLTRLPAAGNKPPHAKVPRP